MSTREEYQLTLTAQEIDDKLRTSVGIQSITTEHWDMMNATTVTINKTDGTSNAFTIPDGESGKSAYAYAVEAGYEGTEGEFAKKLAAEMLALTAEATPILENGTDFDTLIYGGNYRISSAASGATMVNAPTTASGKLIVMDSAGEGRAFQFYLANSITDDIYVRYYSSSGWSEWKKIAYYEAVEKLVEEQIADVTEKRLALIAGENNCTDIASGTDLNTVTACGNYRVPSNTVASSTINIPQSVGGRLTVMESVGENRIFQIFMPNSIDANIFVRYYNGSAWSEWKKIAYSGEAGNAEEIVADAVKTRYSLVRTDYTDIPDGTDFDTLRTGGNLRVPGASNAKTMINCPSTSGGKLIVEETVGTDRIFQTYMTNSSQVLIYRRYYNGSSWSVWKQDAYTSDIGTKYTLPILTMFNHIECIGDSLTYSAVYYGKDGDGNQIYRKAHVSYPQMLAKLTGTPVTELATCSFDPREWFDEYSENIQARNNQLVIMYLGTNGGLTDTLETDAPTDADPSTWARTNTGAYARIVDAYKAIGAKIILVKCYATSASADLETVNNVIAQMAERFGCAVCENEKLTDAIYHYYPDLSGQNSLHYNDLGYAEFTKQLIANINKMSADDMKHLLPV